MPFLYSKETVSAVLFWWLHSFVNVALSFVKKYLNLQNQTYTYANQMKLRFFVLITGLFCISNQELVSKAEGCFLRCVAQCVAFVEKVRNELFRFQNTNETELHFLWIRFFNCGVKSVEFQPQITETVSMKGVAFPFFFSGKLKDWKLFTFLQKKNVLTFATICHNQIKYQQKLRKNDKFSREMSKLSHSFERKFKNNLGLSNFFSKIKKYINTLKKLTIRKIQFLRFFLLFRAIFSQKTSVPKFLPSACPVPKNTPEQIFVSLHILFDLIWKIEILQSLAIYKQYCSSISEFCSYSFFAKGSLYVYKNVYHLQDTTNWF